jgi:NADH-quinone oxidoreductase subunit N
MLTITLLSLLGLAVLFAGFSKNIGLNKTLAASGLLVCLCSLLFIPQDLLLLPGLNTQLSFDSVALKFSSLAIGFTFLVVMLSGSFIRQEFVQSAEFLAVMIFSLVGAVMLTSFTHMVTLFVGLETLGISLYILAGTDKRSASSNEAALKYLLLGAFATGLVLFGLAMMYGASGSLDFATMATLSPSLVDSALMKIGIFFLAIGILFKVSAVPFHFWAPDVYEGSPNVVMAYMSVVVKIASFAALFRIFGLYLNSLSFFWWDLFYYAAIASLIVGNVLAFMQKSIKRQLAYSSISHTGFLLLVILALQNQVSEDGLVFYLLVYGMSVLSVFGVMINWFGNNSDLQLDQLKGAAKTDKTGATILTISFLSMAGIPLTGGFFAKLYMFTPAMQGGLIHLLVIAVLCSVVGAAYYFKPIKNMWFSTENANLETGRSLQWIGFFSATVLILSGFFPDLIQFILTGI